MRDARREAYGSDGERSCGSEGSALDGSDVDEGALSEHNGTCGSPHEDGDGDGARPPVRGRVPVVRLFADTPSPPAVSSRASARAELARCAPVQPHGALARASGAHERTPDADAHADRASAAELDRLRAELRRAEARHAQLLSRVRTSSTVHTLALAEDVHSLWHVTRTLAQSAIDRAAADRASLLLRLARAHTHARREMAADVNDLYDAMRVMAGATVNRTSAAVARVSAERDGYRARAEAAEEARDRARQLADALTDELRMARGYAAAAGAAAEDAFVATRHAAPAAPAAPAIVAAALARLERQLVEEAAARDALSRALAAAERRAALGEANGTQYAREAGRAVACCHALVKAARSLEATLGDERASARAQLAEAAAAARDARAAAKLWRSRCEALESAAAAAVAVAAIGGARSGATLRAASAHAAASPPRAGARRAPNAAARGGSHRRPGWAAAASPRGASASAHAPSAGHAGGLARAAELQVSVTRRIGGPVLTAPADAVLEQLVAQLSEARAELAGAKRLRAHERRRYDLAAHQLLARLDAANDALRAAGVDPVGGAGAPPTTVLPSARWEARAAEPPPPPPVRRTLSARRVDGRNALRTSSDHTAADAPDVAGGLFAWGTRGAIVRGTSGSSVAGHLERRARDGEEEAGDADEEDEEKEGEVSERRSSRLSVPSEGSESSEGSGADRDSRGSRDESRSYAHTDARSDVTLSESRSQSDEPPRETRKSGGRADAKSLSLFGFEGLRAWGGGSSRGAPGAT
ncbi:hypothetical protein KFE25_003965 [Diacronema lutheri]|uniref:Uncharacterized protein n=1 Tax=Diacronema lutheri TaxID=2081491 RepID=A0A8J5XGU3_DIALT|nr:hypothetical protein KFE25_003965 [Diacronema lutheri]